MLADPHSPVISGDKHWTAHDVVSDPGKAAVESIAMADIYARASGQRSSQGEALKQASAAPAVIWAVAEERLSA